MYRFLSGIVLRTVQCEDIYTMCMLCEGLEVILRWRKVHGGRVQVMGNSARLHEGPGHLRILVSLGPWNLSPVATEERLCTYHTFAWRHSSMGQPGTQTA